MLIDAGEGQFRGDWKNSEKRCRLSGHPKCQSRLWLSDDGERRAMQHRCLVCGDKWFTEVADPRQLDLMDGLEMQRLAIEKLTGSRKREAWIRIARDVAFRICRKHGQVTSDDVVREWPIPPEWDRRIMGAVFNARAPDFPYRKGGYTPTTQPQAHGRPIPVWKLKRQGKA